MPRRRQNFVYGVGDDLLALPPAPIVSQRAPTTSDRMEVGTIWVDQPNDDTYILTRVVANSATWINSGGGSGVFATVTTTGAITAGTTLASGTTLGVGTSAVIGTTLTVSGLGLGVVQSSAAGLFSSSAGTDGQLLIADTGAAPVWASITSATLVITPGAGTLNIEESGGTANSFVTDVAGPIAPLAGVTTMAGGTNITTDGSVANTITWDLDDDVTLAGFLSVADDITMLGGDLTITADTDAAQTIYLHANGGTSETIDIHSDQGTGVSAIDIHADVGGIDIDSGLSTVDAINIVASDAAGGIDIDAGTGGIAADTTGAISLGGAAASDFTVTGAFDLTLATTLGSANITAGEAAANAIVIDASNAAGGIDVDCGTGGMSFVAANGVIAFESGTAAINVGADAASHTVTVGSVTGAASTVLQAGTGDLIMTSTDDITIDSAGVLELNSSAGIIGIGNDADAFAINIGVGAAARVITIGNATGASSVVINSGTGAVDIGVNAVAHTVTVGTTTGAGATVLQSGTGNVNITSTDEINLDATGVMEINSSAGVIGIGNDAVAQNINVGTGGAARVITVGNATGATSVVLNAGTGAVDIGVNAIAHTTTVGTVTGAGATVLQSGTGNVNITSTDEINLDATGVMEINSSAGIIGIGNDAVAQNINIGTGGAARVITVGNATGATSVVLNAGTGAVDIGVNAIAHTTTVGTTTGAADTVLQAGTGGLSLEPTGGDVSMVPATNSAAAAALTLDAKLGVATFTGQTTASGAQETFTITNSEVSATSAIFVSVSNVGANDARMTIERVRPAAGSFTVDTQNNGGAALNGDVLISFWVFA